VRPYSSPVRGDALTHVSAHIIIKRTDTALQHTTCGDLESPGMDVVCGWYLGSFDYSSVGFFYDYQYMYHPLAVVSKIPIYMDHRELAAC
jgi:hypothetical protein